MSQCFGYNNWRKPELLNFPSGHAATFMMIQSRVYETLKNIIAIVMFHLNSHIGNYDRIKQRKRDPKPAKGLVSLENSGS